MTDPASSRAGVPGAQYLDASRVVAGMAVFGRGRVAELTVPRLVVLALLGGGFIATGALFSVLLGTGIEPVGTRKLIEVFAFSAGFFFVVLSEAVLFTEANVVLPRPCCPTGASGPGCCASGPWPGSATSPAHGCSAT